MPSHGRLSGVTTRPSLMCSGPSPLPVVAPFGVSQRAIHDDIIDCCGEPCDVVCYLTVFVSKALMDIVGRPQSSCSCLSSVVSHFVRGRDLQLPLSQASADFPICI